MSFGLGKPMIAEFVIGIIFSENGTYFQILYEDSFSNVYINGW